MAPNARWLPLAVTSSNIGVKSDAGLSTPERWPPAEMRPRQKKHDRNSSLFSPSGPSGEPRDISSFSRLSFFSINARLRLYSPFIYPSLVTAAHSCDLTGEHHQIAGPFSFSSSFFPVTLSKPSAMFCPRKALPTWISTNPKQPTEQEDQASVSDQRWYIHAHIRTEGAGVVFGGCMYS